MKTSDEEIFESAVRRMILMIMERLMFRDYSAMDPRIISASVGKTCRHIARSECFMSDVRDESFERVMRCMHWMPH